MIFIKFDRFLIIFIDFYRDCKSMYDFNKLLFQKTFMNFYIIFIDIDRLL